LKKLLTILSFLFAIAAHSQWAVPTGSVVGRQLVIQVPISSLNQQSQALLWMPDDTTAHPGKRYPLMIYLHGSGQGETNNINEQFEESLPQLIRDGLNPYGIDSTTGDTVKYIVVSPHAYNTGWSYSFGHIKWILKYLKETAAWKNRIDTNRVFVSGFSAGGFGTWSCVSEDSLWVRTNLTGIVAISAVEYTTDEPHKQQIRGAVRAKTAIWQVVGASDAWNNSAIKYDSVVNNTPVPLPFRYGYYVVPGLSHEAGVWTEVYRPTVTWFRGKTMWSRLADYSNIAGPIPPPAPTVYAGADSTMTISPVGTNWNMNGTDTGYVYAVPSSTITGPITYLWTQISGPNTARILFPTGQSTPIDNMVVGTYVFQVAATGGNGTFTDQVVSSVRICTPGTPEFHMGIGGDGGAFLGDMSGYLPGSKIWMDSATFPQRTYIYGEKAKGAPGCYVTIAPFGYCEGKDVSMDVSGDWLEISGVPMNQFTKTRTKVGRLTTITTALFFNGRWKERKADGTIEIFNQSGGPAISLQRASSNCFVHDLEIWKRKYCFAFKDDDQCAPNGDTIYNYPNGVMHDNRLFHAYGHYTESQFLYESNTAPNNPITHSRQKACSGLPCGNNCYLEPGRQGDNDVSYCIADSNGRSNIQPSGQEVGMSRFHHNELRYPGGQKDEAQGCNIFLGGYTQAIVDSNFMTNAFTFNGNAFGTRSYWYGNTMDSAGYGSYMQRWVWSGAVGTSTVIDVLPDTTNPLAYGSAFQGRSNTTAPPDPSMVWMKNNAVHAERTADLNNSDKSVFYIYSSPGLTSSSWSTDNRFDGNTYNGAPITGPWQIQAQAGITFTNNAVPYISQVSAGRDYIIKRPWHELIGKAKGMNGTSIISVQWSQLSGPSAAVLSNPNSLQTYVSGLVNGHYIFRFSATNSAELVTEDQMTIDVEGVSASGNPPPAANAGGNQTITGTSVSLNGFGSAGAGTITGYAWTRISGPNTPTITSPSSSSTTVTGLVPGVYVFRFTVTQTDAQTASNDSQVTVVVLPFIGKFIGGNVKTPYRAPAGRFKRKTF
jgi:hypothetical protein